MRAKGTSQWQRERERRLKAFPLGAAIDTAIRHITDLVNEDVRGRLKGDETMTRLVAEAVERVDPAKVALDGITRFFAAAVAERFNDLATPTLRHERTP